MNREITSPQLAGQSMSNVTIVIVVMFSAVVAGIAISQQLWMLALSLLAIPFIVLWPVETALGSFAAIIPFEAVAILIPGAGGSDTTFAWLVGAGAGFVLLMVGIGTRRISRPPASVVWWVVFLAWGTLSLAWAVDRQVAFGRLPLAWSLFGLYALAVCLRVNERELRWIMNFDILGGCAGAAYSIFAWSQGAFYAGTLGRSSMIAGERQADPNQFAATLLLPISLAFWASLTERKWRKKAPMVLATLVMTWSLLLTMSRGALLALMVMMLFYFYRLGLKLKYLAPLLLIPLMVLTVPEQFLNRLAEAGSSHGAGRTDIWHAGATALTKYGVVGAGINNFPVVYSEFAGNAPRFQGFDRGSHNIFLGIAVELGLVGLLLFFLVLKSHFGRGPKGRHHAVGSSRMALLPIEAACWAMLVAGCFLDILWRKDFWLAFMLFTMVGQYLARRGPEVQS